MLQSKTYKQNNYNSIEEDIFNDPNFSLQGVSSSEELAIKRP